MLLENTLLQWSFYQYRNRQQLTQPANLWEVPTPPLKFSCRWSISKSKFDIIADTLKVFFGLISFTMLKLCNVNLLPLTCHKFHVVPVHLRTQQLPAIVQLFRRFYPYALLVLQKHFH